MSRTIPDPIYGTVELDSWIDELLGVPEIAVERRRLERIKNLGLIHMSFPSATHSKWEHHLGMFHLAKQLQLPNEEKKRLELLCLLGGIGHLPFTFPTEDAVLLAARISPDLRRSVGEMCVEIRAACQNALPDEIRRRFPNIVVTMRTQELHAWFSACKLKQLPREIDLGDRAQLVHERINPHARLNELYRFISRLDYVQRDLYYTGLAKFSLSAEGFLRRYKAPTLQELSVSPEARLLDELKSFLADSLYFETKSVSREALYKKKLALILSDAQIGVGELMRSDDGELERLIEDRNHGWWTDFSHEEFTRICSTRLQRRPRGVGDDHVELESRVLGRHTVSPTFLARYPRNYGFLVVPRRSTDTRDGGPFLDVFVSAVGNPRRCTGIVEAVHRLSDLYAGIRTPAVTQRSLIQDLLSYLLNASVRIDYRQIAELLAAGFLRLSERAKRSFVRRLDRSRFESYFYLYFRPSRLDTVDSWEELIRAPHFVQFLREGQKYIGELLKLGAQSDGADFGRVVEATIWIAECRRLRYPGWVLPNVIIEGKARANQVDAISLFVRRRKAVLRFHECSKSDSEGKALDDLQKLQKIKGRAKLFDDLLIEQIVYGASGVRDHFSPLQPLLDEYGIREKPDRKAIAPA